MLLSTWNIAGPFKGWLTAAFYMGYRRAFAGCQPDEHGCQPDEPQASLATTNRCNHVYIVLFFILLFMYAVIHCLYSVWNNITITTL